MLSAMLSRCYRRCYRDVIGDIAITKNCETFAKNDVIAHRGNTVIASVIADVIAGVIGVLSGCYRGVIGVLAFRARRQTSTDMSLHVF